MGHFISKDKKFCECGCGELIPVISYKHIVRRFKHGHNPQNYKFPKGYHGSHGFVKGCTYGHKIKKGEYALDKHWKWKGGRVIDKDGYIMVRAEGHPRSTKRGYYVREHIIIMEKYLGRYLTDKEVVHHINHDKQDNQIENLLLLESQSIHASMHKRK